mgnify:CR=1 FL=1
MVMDYWCSLWFWDVRKAEHLPTRQQYVNDIASILNIDLTKQPKAEKETSSYTQEATPTLFEFVFLIPKSPVAKALFIPFSIVVDLIIL